MGFLLDSPAEILGLWVYGACHGEILPYQYPVLIAVVEESVILVDVATLAAYHVASKIVCERQRIRQTLDIP